MPHASLQEFDRALMSADSSGVHVMDNLLYANAVYAALINGDVPLARTFLQTMSASLPFQAVLDAAHYWSLHALVDLHSGSFAEAIDHGRRAFAVVAGTMPFGDAQCHLFLAAALYETNERQAAQEHLDAMRAIGVGMGSRQIAYWCHALEAHSSFVEGNIAAGRESLTRTLALSREMDGSPMYWWPRARVAQFYAKALEYGIETDHVCDLIRRLGLVLEASATVPDSWPLPVKSTLSAASPYILTTSR